MGVMKQSWPGNKRRKCAIKEQFLSLHLSKSEMSWEERWWDERRWARRRKKKSSQPKNSLRLPLRQPFKSDGAVLMIKLNIWGRPRHYWFYASRLRRSRNREGLLIACFAYCSEIQRAESTWNPIPKSKPQASFPLVTTAPVYSAANTGGELCENNRFLLQPFLLFSKDWTQDECSTPTLMHTFTCTCTDACTRPL